MSMSKASRVLLYLWIVCVMSLLSRALLAKEIPGPLSTVSPSGCQLRNTSLGTKATCTHLNLKSVPQDLPRNTVILDLSFNKIKTLYNESFTDLPDIISLGLASNILIRIESGAFAPLVYLKKLSLHQNRLVSLPSGLFGINRLLSTLILGKNKLTSIPSDALPWSNSITTFDLSGNNISFINPRKFIPLQNCSLEKLFLGSNALSRLPLKVFSYLNNVSYLGLSKNVFSAWHISSLLGNLKIKVLVLDACKIHDIIPLNKSHANVTDFPQILGLHLKGNRIMSIPDFAFWGLYQTKILELQGNRISILSNKSLCGLDRLMKLDLSRNFLTSLTFRMFSCNKMLQHLQLSKNKIVSFSTDIVLGLSSLYYLDLSGNNIKDVKSHYRRTTPSMEYLDLSFNKLTVIKKYFLIGFINLKILNMSHNDINNHYSPNSFAKLKHLKELYLENERYQYVNKAFRYMESLCILQLSFSEMHLRSKYQFTNLSSLLTLGMREDKLESADLYDIKTQKSLFWGLKSLEKLNLRGNQLTILAQGTFDPLKKLQVLDLSQSSIRVLSPGVFNSLTSLATLDLNDNEILMLSHDLLQGHYKLGVLYISNNNLESIPKTLFNGTPSLHTLYMQRNRITTMEPKTMFPTNKTLHLYAFGNPFSCTCDLSWFVKWLHSGHVELRHPEKTSCSLSSIKEEVNSPILSFNPDQYCGINVVMITGTSFSVVLVSVICLVAYKKRWWLNYKVFLLKLAIFGYEEINQEFDAQDYEYQLNLMYIEDDQEWVDQVMKPMLQDRFPHLQKVVFGDNNLNIEMYYINALHYAVENSFKTVLLLSNNSVDDAWFLTKMRIALEHLNDTRLDKVILLFLEDIQDDDLPYLARLFLSKNKPYMLWTEDEDGQELFWAQFEKSMRANRVLNSVIPV